MSQLFLLLINFVFVKSDGDISHPYCFTKERPRLSFLQWQFPVEKIIANIVTITCQPQNQMWLVGVALRHWRTATTGIDLTPQSGHKKGGDRG